MPSKTVAQFYINKGGLPLDEYHWNKMWSHSMRINKGDKDIIEEIRQNNRCKEVNIPKIQLDYPIEMTIQERLEQVQEYMNTLQYNHTGMQFYEIRKGRTVSGLMELAKTMIKESLPIKCLEAVILGLYLTNNITKLDRFSIGFTTVFLGTTYRHVVLGVHYNGLYGALGLSRRRNLMDKPLEYQTLADMIIDFINAYQNYLHTVEKVTVGLPVTHNTHSYDSICWKAIEVCPSTMSRDLLSQKLNQHAREIKQEARVLATYGNHIYSVKRQQKSSSAPQRLNRGQSNVQKKVLVLPKVTTASLAAAKEDSKTDLSTYHVQV